MSGDGHGAGLCGPRIEGLLSWVDTYSVCLPEVSFADSSGSGIG